MIRRFVRGRERFVVPGGVRVRRATARFATSVRLSKRSGAWRHTSSAELARAASGMGEDRSHGDLV